MATPVYSLSQDLFLKNQALCQATGTQQIWSPCPQETSSQERDTDWETVLTTGIDFSGARGHAEITLILLAHRVCDYEDNIIKTSRSQKTWVLWS